MADVITKIARRIKKVYNISQSLVYTDNDLGDDVMLIPLLPGHEVLGVQVNVTEAYDGTSPVLAIKDADAKVYATGIDLTAVAKTDASFARSEAVLSGYLYAEFGGSGATSQGAVRISVEFVKSNGENYDG